MSKKQLSTFEIEMQNEHFAKEFEESYNDFLLSDTIIGMMNENKKTVRGLAEETGLSASMIQKMRSGKQKGMNLNNLIIIAKACGYHIDMYNDKRRLTIV
ncbi:MAG: helix-turn-helix transcriptional regulator [Candidatus Paracaedibacteraceae bacterium]|nr:helix-turn-helix transcriptional regulator [Candidatus Paracaedibacteraceae bacterium]